MATAVSKTPRSERTATRGPASGRPGIVDVAARAGVSHITVSRVINGRPSVSEATKLRVTEALRALGYRPNTAARALVTGRSSTIGVVCYNTAMYGASAALLGLEQAARARGYSVAFVGLTSTDRLAVEDAIQRLRLQTVAGIVAVSPQAAMAEAVRHVSIEIPTVAIWGHPGPTIPTVSSAETAGARLATTHLIDLGHRNIAHLAGPKDRVSTKERQRGWRMALKEHGLRARPPVHGDWSAQSGYAAGKRILADAAVSAIFVANDQMALGVLRAIHETGRRVPDDISVVGFDDVPDAAYFSPPLTTIRQDFARLGQRGFELVLEAIEGRGTLQSSSLPVELVVRATSGAPTPR